jgi:pilus assembly protein Flp/PilA
MLTYFVSLAGYLARRLGRDDRGATAVEYGLIVALIAAVIVITVGLLGTAVDNAFQKVLQNM